MSPFTVWCSCACSGESAFPHMLPTVPQFTQCARSLGVSAGSPVVVYDGAHPVVSLCQCPCHPCPVLAGKGIFSAPRLAWTFNVFGHDNVAVLGPPAGVAQPVPSLLLCLCVCVAHTQMVACLRGSVRVCRWRAGRPLTLPHRILPSKRSRLQPPSSPPMMTWFLLCPLTAWRPPAAPSWMRGQGAGLMVPRLSRAPLCPPVTSKAVPACPSYPSSLPLAHSRRKVRCPRSPCCSACLCSARHASAVLPPPPQMNCELCFLPPAAPFIQMARACPPSPPAAAA